MGLAIGLFFLANGGWRYHNHTIWLGPVVVLLTMAGLNSGRQLLATLFFPISVIVVIMASYEYAFVYREFGNGWLEPLQYFDSFESVQNLLLISSLVTAVMYSILFVSVIIRRVIIFTFAQSGNSGQQSTTGDKAAGQQQIGTGVCKSSGDQDQGGE